MSALCQKATSGQFPIADGLLIDGVSKRSITDPAETHGSWSLHAAGGSNAYENREPRRACLNLSDLRTHKGPVEP